MKIAVYREDGARIRLHLPDGLVFNRLSASLFSEILKRKNIHISGKQLRAFFRVMRKNKARHPEWKLMEGRMRKGETVEIVMR